jgi:hypothetical protein
LPSLNFLLSSRFAFPLSCVTVAQVISMPQRTAHASNQCL